MSSYNKNNPTGIRFNEEKLTFIKGQHPNLKTKQQVVNYLLDEFYWRHNISQQTPNSVAKSEVSEQHTTTYEPTIPKIRPSDAYLADIKRATSISQLEIISGEFWADMDVPKHEQNRLQAIAVQKSQEIDV